MTAKNIDLDKLEWSEWEYYGPNDAVKFFERSRGCYAMHNAWATVCGDRKFIVVKGVIDTRRAWREIVHGESRYPEGITGIHGTWKFAKIPQEEAKETNQPNPFPSDVVEKEEPESSFKMWLEIGERNGWIVTKTTKSYELNLSALDGGES